MSLRVLRFTFTVSDRVKRLDCTLAVLELRLKLEFLCDDLRHSVRKGARPRQFIPLDTSVDKPNLVEFCLLGLELSVQCQQTAPCLRWHLSNLLTQLLFKIGNDFAFESARFFLST